MARDGAHEYEHHAESYAAGDWHTPSLRSPSPSRSVACDSRWLAVLTLLEAGPSSRHAPPGQRRTRVVLTDIRKNRELEGRHASQIDSIVLGLPHRPARAEI